MYRFILCQGVTWISFYFFLANHLTDKDAKAFAEALKENRTLTHLDLSHNEIGEVGGIYLGAGLVTDFNIKFPLVSIVSIFESCKVDLMNGSILRILKRNSCETCCFPKFLLVFIWYINAQDSVIFQRDKKFRAFLTMLKFDQRRVDLRFHFSTAEKCIILWKRSAAFWVLTQTD